MAREILWPVIRPNAFYRAKDAGKTDEKAGKTGGKMFCGVSLSVKSLRGKGAPPVRRIPLGKSGVLDFSGDICAPGVEWACKTACPHPILMIFQTKHRDIAADHPI